MHKSILTLPLLALGAHAHVAAWTRGMYCLNGASTSEVTNTDLAVKPLYNLPKSKWWFQADRGCDKFPPTNGDILKLPANGQFTVELAHNKGQTTLAHPDGQGVTDWPDGNQHPEDYHAIPPAECVDDGALHTVNQSTAGGTAWAISYQSDLSKVTMENLVVFSTAYNTPWKRLATYKVPDLPACPAGGCTCAWLWSPNGCGEPNFYMAGYKCTVTGATSTKKLGTAKPPTYCANGAGTCQSGPKQMIAWNAADGNNVQVPGGQYPNYNMKNGFKDGAQTDIFV